MKILLCTQYHRYHHLDHARYIIVHAWGAPCCNEVITQKKAPTMQCKPTANANQCQYTQYAWVHAGFLSWQHIMYHSQIILRNTWSKTTYVWKQCHATLSSNEYISSLASDQRLCWRAEKWPHVDFPWLVRCHKGRISTQQQSWCQVSTSS